MLEVKENEERTLMNMTLKRLTQARIALAKLKYELIYAEDKQLNIRNELFFDISTNPKHYGLSTTKNDLVYSWITQNEDYKKATKVVLQLRANICIKESEVSNLDTIWTYELHILNLPDSKSKLSETTLK